MEYQIHICSCFTTQAMNSDARETVHVAYTYLWSLVAVKTRNTNPTCDTK